MFFPHLSIALLWKFYFLGIFLFLCGLAACVLQQKSLLLVLMALELSLLGVSLLFILASICTGTLQGQIVVFVLLTLGGAESAFGLALLMLYFNFRGDISLQTIADLKY